MQNIAKVHRHMFQSRSILPCKFQANLIGETVPVKGLEYDFRLG